jgi:hypothetical protein
MMAYSHFRTCPACRKDLRPDSNDAVKYGSYRVHRWCTVTCVLCDAVIPAPAVGAHHAVTSWCDKPAHRACKEKHG